jgi:tetratricopeptide (TPR) repeat protein
MVSAKLVENLTRTIEAAEMALEIMPVGYPERSAMLSNLANVVLRLCQQSQAPEHLRKGVKITKLALAATTFGLEHRMELLRNLVLLTSALFETTNSQEDLDAAIEVDERAARVIPPGDQSRAKYLGTLGNHLSSRFDRTHELKDIDRAIEVAEMVVAITPRGHELRAKRLSNVGTYFGSRFRETRERKDIRKAIEFATMAQDATSLDDPSRALCVASLARHLVSLFVLDRELKILEQAIAFAEEAKKVVSRDDPNLDGIYDTYASVHKARFERKGQLEDIDQAIETAEAAVKSGRPRHPNQSYWLNTLASYLSTRFEWIGAMDDIDKAVSAGEKAIDSMPANDPDEALFLFSLGTNLGLRFERTWKHRDLERAIKFTEKAVAVAAPNDPERGPILGNLGRWFVRMFRLTQKIEDLDKAIDFSEKGLDATPPKHPSLPIYLNNLGVSLAMRYDETKQVRDLNRAVEVATAALEISPPDHPERAYWLYGLGIRFRTLFEQTGAEEDLEKARTAFRNGWDLTDAHPVIRIRLARGAAGIHATQSEWKEASALLSSAVELLPFVTTRSLEHTDKEDVVTRFDGLASEAAAASLSAGEKPEQALKLLELGRSVISGLLLEMRVDITEIERHDPELAKEFITLRDQLDSPRVAKASATADGETLFTSASRAKQRREAETRYREIVEQLRRSGFETLFFEPTVEELQRTADPDPIVVVNTSPLRCDAFAVRRDEIKHISLPDLEFEDIEPNATRLRSPSSSSGPVLEWLWRVAAYPILESMGISQPPPDGAAWPHIWWVLAGPLRHLPFHAAGQHFKGSTNTVLDRVMSSYALSIKALSYTRRLSTHKPAESGIESAILVAMEKTPGQRDLIYAAKEVRMLCDICPALHLNPLTPPPRRDEILAHLRGCKIFHFAGHGHSSSEPSQSYLLLEDGKSNSVTVADLRDLRLHENAPFLGYLSACSTGDSRPDALIDEGVHLINSCQLAGFRHVIGTLWEVSDSHCLTVAKIFYETLRGEGMEDRSVYRALHKAIAELRDADNELRSAKSRGGEGADDDDDRDRGDTIEVGQEDTHESVLPSEEESHLLEGTRDPVPKSRKKVALSFQWVPFVHFGV